MGVAEHATVLDDLPVGGADAVANDDVPPATGGRRRRGRKGSKKRGTKKRGTKKRGSKKGGSKKRGSKKSGTKRKGASPWIMHVKAFCKKTGKTFPEALKDPMCGKTYKR